MILIHVGTNDASAGASTEEFIGAYDTILWQMRKYNPDIRIMLSKLIAIDHRRYGQAVANRIKDYNTALGEWAKQKNESRSPISVVDVYSGFQYQSMTRDGKHPNEEGDKFIAERYFNAIQQACI